MTLSDADHDVGCLDDGGRGFTDLQVQVRHRFVGDGGRQDRAADVDADMRCGRALGDLGDGPGDLVTCADFHV